VLVLRDRAVPLAEAEALFSKAGIGIGHAFPEGVQRRRSS
jgi:hypothetical protein